MVAANKQRARRGGGQNHVGGVGSGRSRGVFVKKLSAAAGQTNGGGHMNGGINPMKRKQNFNFNNRALSLTRLDAIFQTSQIPDNPGYVDFNEPPPPLASPSGGGNKQSSGNEKHLQNQQQRRRRYQNDKNRPQQLKNRQMGGGGLGRNAWMGPTLPPSPQMSRIPPPPPNNFNFRSIQMGRNGGRGPGRSIPPAPSNLRLPGMGMGVQIPTNMPNFGIPRPLMPPFQMDGISPMGCAPRLSMHRGRIGGRGGQIRVVPGSAVGNGGPNRHIINSKIAAANNRKVGKTRKRPPANSAGTSASASGKTKKASSKKTLSEIINQYPLDKPWITEEICAQHRKKEEIENKLKGRKDDQLFAEFKIQLDKFVQLYVAAQQQYNSKQPVKDAENNLRNKTDKQGEIKKNTGKPK